MNLNFQEMSEGDCFYDDPYSKDTNRALIVNVSWLTRMLLCGQIHAC